MTVSKTRTGPPTPLAARKPSALAADALTALNRMAAQGSITESDLKLLEQFRSVMKTRNPFSTRLRSIAGLEAVERISVERVSMTPHVRHRLLALIHGPSLAQEKAHLRALERATKDGSISAEEVKTVLKPQVSSLRAGGDYTAAASAVITSAQVSLSPEARQFFRNEGGILGLDQAALDRLWH